MCRSPSGKVSAMPDTRDHVHEYSCGVLVHEKVLEALDIPKAPYLEEDIESCLAEVVAQFPENSQVIILGACFGFYAAFIGTLRPDLTFQVYEPEPSNREMLVSTLILNGIEERVQVFEEALGETDGVV